MPKKTKRNDIAVKVDFGIVKEARIICAHRNVTLAELLSEMLRQPIHKELEKCLKELNQRE